MDVMYVVHYTLFSFKYNSGFRSYYRFFDNELSMKKFINSNPNLKINDNCIIFKRVEGS